MPRRAGGIAVLHVDDEPDFGDLAAEYLERQDGRLAVETATSASDGLDRLAGGGFDCVVSDYDMPGLDGIEFLEAVRESHPDLPFILYTGKGSEEVASEAISAGVTDYLQKEAGTSQYEVLANRITNAVEQRRAREEADQTERRLRTIAENVEDVLWKFTADWDELLFINSAYEEIWGRPVDELREAPRSFLEGVHPEDRALIEEAMAQLSAGESVDFECRVNAEEAYGRWVWVQGQPVLDHDGEVEKVVGFARDITERKAQTRRFEALIEHSMDVITVVDDAGTITYESPSVERILGYDPSELVGENGFEFIHPDDRDRVRSLFEEQITQPDPQPTRVSYRFKHADGHWVWLETLGRMTMDQAVDGFVLNSRDITGRREQERELEAQREDLTLYRQAIEGSTDLLAAADGEYTLLFANERYRAYHGLQRDDVGRIRLPEYLGDTWETAVRPRLDRALSGETVRYEMQRTGPDGEPRTLDIRYYPLTEPDGTVTGAVAAFRDITERQDHVRKLSALHDVAEDLTRLESVQAVCERTVRASEEILAFDLSAIDLEEGGLLKKTAVSEDVPPENMTDMPVDEGIAGRTFRTGESFVIGDLRSHPDADPQGPYQSVLSVPIGAHGVFQAVAESADAFDETDLELAELLITHGESALDRIEREQALQRQNDRLDEFAGLVSHDLRNPLTVAKGRLELAAEECDSEHLGSVAGAHDRMETLIEDLLTLARAGESVGDVEPVALSVLADACWSQVATGGAELTVDTDVAVQADRSRLRQLLENLFRNAIEHGGPEVTVSVGGTADGFYVEDDGPGIPESDRENVFDPGYTTSADGTGFGLSIVRDIAEAHGWTIGLSTAESGGVRFEVTGVEVAN